MQIVNNHGTNLPDAAVEHYGIVIAPATLLVDGVAHDTREPPITHEELDAWVKSAKEFPHVVGTSAHEFMQTYTEAAKTDPEILVVTASPKMVHTFQAATAAARTMQERPQYAHVKINIVDSGLVDIGVGMLTMLAAEASLGGVPLRRAVGLLETIALRSKFVGTVATLDNLVRGGRASFLRAWLADRLEIRPLLGLQSGELKSVGKINKRNDTSAAITDELAKVGDGRRVWACVAHGSAPDRARELLAAMKSRFDVAYSLTVPLSAGVYLHAGRGSVFGGVFPIDRLPWEPTTPPPFDMP